MKKAIIGLALLAAAAAGVLAFVEFEPKTPVEALDRAEKKLTKLYATPGLDEAAAKLQQDKVLDRFRFVGTKWPGVPEAAKAAARIAELLRTWKRLDEALAAYDALATADGDWTAAEFCDKDLKRPGDAMKRFAAFGEKHAADPRADDADWRVIELKVAAGRAKFAPGDLMAAAEAFLKKWPTSDHRAKAMLLIADTLRDVKERDAAMAKYAEILELFEGSPEGARALDERAKLLAEMGKNKEAAKAYEELERKYPDSPEARKSGGSGGSREKAQKGADEEESDEREKDFLKEHYGRQGGDLLGASMPRGTPLEFVRDLIDQKIDLERVELEIAPDPGKASMTASGRFRMVNRGAEKKSLRMLLSPNFTLTKAVLDGKELKVEQKDGRLLVTLAAPAAAEAVLDLVLEWSGGEVGDAAAFRLRADGYAAPAGIFWYPVTVPGDLHGGTVAVKAAGLTAVSGGADPTFGLFFAYGSYAVAEKGPVRYLTIDSSAKRVQEVLDRAADIVDFFSKEFGPLPRPGLTLVDVDLPEHIGGISPCGLIFLNREFMATTHDATSLLAHEIAHQWWGNLVPVAMLHPDYSAWLSEGLASHADALYLEARFGAERSRQHLEKGCQVYLERSFKLADDALHSCWYGHPEYFAVVYLKGAATLEMLRRDIGPGSYAAGLRRYAAEGRHKATGVSDFRAAMEAESKRDLKAWFAQWVDAAGYPSFAVDVEGSTLVIRQDGKPFATKVEVAVDGVIRVVEVSRVEERFPLEAAPKKVVLDPAGKLIKKPGPKNEWAAK